MKKYKPKTQASLDQFRVAIKKIKERDLEDWIDDIFDGNPIGRGHLTKRDEMYLYEHGDYALTIEWDLDYINITASVVGPHGEEGFSETVNVKDAKFYKNPQGAVAKAVGELQRAADKANALPYGHGFESKSKSGFGKSINELADLIASK